MTLLMPHRIRRLHWQARAPTAPAAFALRGLLREATDEVLAALENSLSAHIPADRVVRLPRLALHLQLPAGADHTDLVQAIEHAVAEALAGLDITGLPQAGSSAPPQQPAPAGPPGLAVLRSLPHAEQQRLLKQALDGRQADDDSTPISLPLPGSPARLPLGLIRQMARQLRDGDASAPVRTIDTTGSSPAHHAQASLDTYLVSGYVDWTLAGLDPETLLQILREAALAWVEPDALPAAIARLRPALRPGAVARWLALLPLNRRSDALAARRDADDTLARHPLTPLLREHALAGGPASASWIALWLAWRLAADDAQESLDDRCRDLLPLLPPLADAEAQTLRAALDAAPPSGPAAVSPPPTLPAAPPRTSPHTAPPSFSQRPREAAPTGLLVPAAGLVLAHPYLPRLFDATGLYSAGTRGPLPDPTLPAAASLLHWLATGREAEQEFSLPFIKLLLGRDPDTPLPHAPAPLPEAWREEADALLDAMLSHWQALRGTRPAGLRSGFLQRRGCLEQRDSTWHLRIEPESFDMLLDLLPWGFSLVRLPWMPRPLVTEWPTP